MSLGGEQWIAARPKYLFPVEALGIVFRGTWFDVLRPYVPLRVFGGPIFWRYQGQSVTGTDTHHCQVGLGFALQVQRHIHVFAEGIPLGERALSLGISSTFAPWLHVAATCGPGCDEPRR